MTERGAQCDKACGCLCGGLIGDAMAAPAESKHFRETADQFGEITGFTGMGTDDTAVKHVLVHAILSKAESGGRIAADELAEAFLGHGARQHA